MNFATLVCISTPAVIIYKKISLSVNVVKFGHDRIIDVYMESLSALYFSHVIIKWYSSSVWCAEHVLHTLSSEGMGGLAYRPRRSKGYVR